MTERRQDKTVPREKYDQVVAERDKLRAKYDKVVSERDRLLDSKNKYKQMAHEARSISEEDVRQHEAFKQLEEKCQELRKQIKSLISENMLLQSKVERLDDLEWRYDMIADIVKEQTKCGNVT